MKFVKPLSLENSADESGGSRKALRENFDGKTAYFPVKTMIFVIVVVIQLLLVAVV